MSIIFILAGLVLTFSYTNPTYRGMSGNPDISKKSVVELIDEKTKYEAAIQKTKEIEEVRNGLQTKYNLITNIDKQRLDKMIPSNIDSVRLIIDVNNVASAYGMSLRDISISDAPASTARKDAPVLGTQSGTYSYENLSFSLTGSYDNLVSFLFDLEKNLRISDVTSLSLDPADKESASASDSKTKNTKTDPQYKMKITLKTYFLGSK